jgi:hypothetical protein
LKTAGGWPAFATERYTVLEEIGRGGMGTVLALDEELKREVAIKIPNAPAGGGSNAGCRSRRGARVAEHPGSCRFTTPAGSPTAASSTS